MSSGRDSASNDCKSRLGYNRLRMILHSSRDCDSASTVLQNQQDRNIVNEKNTHTCAKESPSADVCRSSKVWESDTQDTARKAAVHRSGSSGVYIRHRHAVSRFFWQWVLSSYAIVRVLHAVVQGLELLPSQSYWAHADIGMRGSILQVWNIFGEGSVGCMRI